MLSFHRFQLRRTMGRQLWSRFSKAWKQYPEKYDFHVSLSTLLGLSLVFSSGLMAFRYQQHQSQAKGLNTWVSRLNCWAKQVCYLTLGCCLFCQFLQQVNYEPSKQQFCFWRCHGHCYSISHMLHRICEDRIAIFVYCLHELVSCCRFIPFSYAIKMFILMILHTSCSACCSKMVAVSDFFLHPSDAGYCYVYCCSILFCLHGQL